MRATIRVEGLDAPRGRLRSLALNLADPAEALISAADEIAAANVARIEKGVRPKLSPRYARRKAQAGQSPKPLIATGSLLRSLEPGAPQNILRAFSRVVRYGTSHPLAHLHQDGRGVPRRRVVTAGGKKARVAAAEAARDHLLPRRRGLRSMGLS